MYQRHRKAQPNLPIGPPSVETKILENERFNKLDDCKFYRGLVEIDKIYALTFTDEKMEIAFQITGIAHIDATFKVVQTYISFSLS